jgi:hypothetical protein
MYWILGGKLEFSVAYITHPFVPFLERVADTLVANLVKSLFVESETLDLPKSNSAASSSQDTSFAKLSMNF